MHKSIICFACESREVLNLDKESGEIVCGSCGVIIDERIEDIANDKRVLSPDSMDKRRIGPRHSLTSRNKGFSTVIGKQNYKGGADGSVGIDFGRIREWDSRIRSSHDKRLEKALFELGRLRECLALPDAVAERSAYFIRKSSDFGLTKERTVASLTAASVYLACREAEVPKTLDEIARISNVRRKRLARDYRLLFRTFEKQLPVTDLPRCVTKIANMTGVGEAKKRRAIELVNALTEIGVSAGKSPLGLAAAAIYLICKNTDEEKTQAALAKAAGVTEVTIRNRCGELIKLFATKKIPNFNSSLFTVAVVSIQFVMVTNARDNHA